MTARRTVTAAERSARLAVRHRLVPSRRTDDVVRITDDIVALHSSDPVSVYLSATARMRNPALAAVSSALYDDRTLIRHHAMRRTLWVFGAETARAAHGSCTVDLVELERRRIVQLIEASGVTKDGDHWLREAKSATLAELAGREQATARQIGDAVPSLRVPLELAVGTTYAAAPSAHTRVLLLLGFEAQVVRTRPTGTWINGQYHWAAMSRWRPDGVAGMGRATAAAGLADRWLRAFGPALAADLQWWAGWSARTTAAALAGCGAVEVDLDGVPGWAAADDVEPDDATIAQLADPEPWVALLPGLDPTTMGWKQRSWYLDPAVGAQVFDRNGNGGPTIWADGRVVGAWVQRRNGEIAVRLLTHVGTHHRQAIDTAAGAMREMLAETRFSVRFPAPMTKALLS